MSKVACAACQHQIDDAVKICPYCGSDPRTGRKIIDADAMLREEFTPRHSTTSDTVLEFARHRQGIVVGATAIVAFLILLGLHQYVTMRNATAVSSEPAVPLTELTDVSAPPADAQPSPMPPLTFQHSGNPNTMRTLIVEAGATTPPEVLAAQQAAAQQAAAAKQTAAAQRAGVPGRPIPPGANQLGVRPGAVPAQPARPGAVPPARPGAVPPVPPRTATR